MEHPRIEPFLPLLVLDSGLRDLSRWLHLPYVWGMLPDLFYHHCPGCGVHELYGGDCWPYVLFPFLVRLDLVSVYFLSIASRETIQGHCDLATAFCSHIVNWAGGNGCTISLHSLT
jgi:hypothetical protein